MNGDANGARALQQQRKINRDTGARRWNEPFPRSHGDLFYPLLSQEAPRELFKYCHIKMMKGQLATLVGVLLVVLGCRRETHQPPLQRVAAVRGACIATLAFYAETKSLPENMEELYKLNLFTRSADTKSLQVIKLSDRQVKIVYPPSGDVKTTISATVSSTSSGLEFYYDFSKSHSARFVD